MSLNVWNFTGNLGRDAEQKYLPNGMSVVEFSPSVESGFGDNKVTMWPRCAMFGDRGAKVLQYLVKGQQVAVSGEIKLRDWKNKDGETKTSLEVRVTDLQLIGKKSSGGEQAPRQQQESRPAPASAGQAAEKKRPSFEDMDDDIPF